MTLTPDVRETFTTALANVLAEIIDARAAQHREHDGLKLVAWDAGDDPGRIPTREESALAYLANAECCREWCAIWTLRWIGAELHRIGGIGLMQEISEEASERHPKRPAYA